MHFKNIILILIVISISFSFCTTRASSPVDIHTILIKSIGGEKAVARIKSLRSIHATGKVTMNGALGDFDLKIKFPDNYIISLNFPDFSLVEGYDGTVAWQQDISGNKTKLSATDKKSLLSTIYMNTYSFLFDDSLNNKKYLGKVEIDNQMYHSIIFRPQVTDSIIAYYNMTTGYREILKTKQDLIEIHSIESSYQTVEQIAFAFSTISIVEKYNVSISQLTNKVAFDINFHDSLFEFRKDTDKKYRFEPIAQFEIPFVFQNNHIFVLVNINGKKVYMLLDTGAGSTILNSSFAQELSLDTAGTIPSVGISGASYTQLVQIDSLQVGNITLYDQIVGSIDLHGLIKRNINKIPFGGILGNNFLSQFPFLVNYRDLKIRFYNPDIYSPPTGGLHIPFEYYMLIPTIEAKVGSVKGKFIVDLGNAFGLILHHHFVTAQNLDAKIKNKTKLKNLIGGVGGAVSGIEGVIDSFIILDKVLTNEKVYLPKESYGLSGSSEIAGNIGNALLKRYVIFFDYLKNEIILFDSLSLKD